MLRTRVALTGPVSGAAVITQHWLSSDDSAGVTAARAALSTWLTAVAGQCHTSLGFSLEPEVDVVDPNTGQVTGVLTAAALNVSGTNAGDLLPLATQWLCRWRTDDFVGGREVRGRTFIPGPTRNGALNGQPTTAAIAALNAANATLVGDSAAGFAVWSRKLLSAHDVSSGSAWSKFAVLRSRRD